MTKKQHSAKNDKRKSKQISDSTKSCRKSAASINEDVPRQVQISLYI